MYYAGPLTIFQSRKPLESPVVLAGMLLGLHLLTVSSAHALTFTRVTTGPVVSDGGYSRSFNFVDFDNDGWLDVSVGNGATDAGVDAVNFLYRNNGDGTFTKITDDTTVATLASSDGHTWGDYDGDGRLDLFVATWKGQIDLLYRNIGGGHFERISTTPLTAETNYSDFASWVDYDHDGDMDMFVAVGFSTPLNNLLFRNDGGGIFTKVITGPVVVDAFRSHGTSWGDYDNDGLIDLFVCNVGQPANLYRNLGGGAFAKILTGAIVTTPTVAIRSSWGDYDNDLDLDLVVANTSNQNELLYRNNGDGTFTSVLAGDPVIDGDWSNAAGFADLDNDGDLDLLVTNGFATPQDRNSLYLNDGAGNFIKELTGPVATDTGWSVGFSFGDIDKDGDLDIGIAKCLFENEDNVLYLNDGNGNHWLEMSFRGAGNNHFGVGTRVEVKATIGGSPRWQMRETTSPTGAGQNGLTAHFGLGDAMTADSVVIKWPDGTTEVYTDLAPDQYLTAIEGGGLCSAPDNDADGAVEPGPGTFGCAAVDNCPNLFNPDQADLDNNNVGDACQGCCFANTGNVDCDPGDLADGSDLGMLVDFIFFDVGPLCCPKEADVDGDTLVDGADLGLMVDFIFFDLTPPGPCLLQ